MSSANLLLVSAIACGSMTCPYHNSEFGYSVQFPKMENTMVCVPDGPGGRHGARLLLDTDGSCERLNEPSIGVSVDYNAMDWANSVIAAKAVCRDGTAERIDMKVDGVPVAKCQQPYRFVKNWTVLSYITVRGGSSGTDVVLTIGMTVPSNEVSKYEPIARDVLKAIKFDTAR